MRNLGPFGNLTLCCLFSLVSACSAENTLDMSSSAKVEASNALLTATHQFAEQLCIEFLNFECVRDQIYFRDVSYEEVVPTTLFHPNSTLLDCEGGVSKTAKPLCTFEQAWFQTSSLQTAAKYYSQRLVRATSGAQKFSAKTDRRLFVQSLRDFYDPAAPDTTQSILEASLWQWIVLALGEILGKNGSFVDVPLLDRESNTVVFDSPRYEWEQISTGLHTGHLTEILPKSEVFMDDLPENLADGPFKSEVFTDNLLQSFGYIYYEDHTALAYESFAFGQSFTHKKGALLQKLLHHFSPWLKTFDPSCGFSIPSPRIQTFGTKHEALDAPEIAYVVSALVADLLLTSLEVHPRTLTNGEGKAPLAAPPFLLSGPDIGLLSGQLLDRKHWSSFQEELALSYSHNESTIDADYPAMKVLRWEKQKCTTILEKNEDTGAVHDYSSTSFDYFGEPAAFVFVCLDSDFHGVDRELVMTPSTITIAASEAQHKPLHLFLVNVSPANDDGSYTPLVAGPHNAVSISALATPFGPSSSYPYRLTSMPKTVTPLSTLAELQDHLIYIPPGFGNTMHIKLEMRPGYSLNHLQLSIGLSKSPFRPSDPNHPELYTWDPNGSDRIDFRIEP